MKDKFADLEDRSRCNNITLWGIPESLPPQEIVLFIKRLLHLLLPEAPDSALLINKAHRIPKPKFLPPTIARDVIARLHFFHIKEAAIQAIRRAPALPEEFANISLFTDLSAATLQSRRKFALITQHLQKNKILYKWDIY